MAPTSRHGGGAVRGALGIGAEREQGRQVVDQRVGRPGNEQRRIDRRERSEKLDLDDVTFRDACRSAWAAHQTVGAGERAEHARASTKREDDALFADAGA